jgi:signal transduction histidine kinase
MDRFKRQALYSWAFIAVLTTLSILLAILQYRWIGEVSRAEEDRLKGNLRTSLERLRSEFNDTISQACNALTLSADKGPDGIPASASDRDALYIQKFKRWRDAGHQERLFASITRVIPGPEGSVILRVLDQPRATFRTIDWPASWGPLRDEFIRQIADEGRNAPPRTDGVDLLVIPLFGARHNLPIEWVVFEVNTQYVRAAMMPDLMKHLTGYDAELVSRTDASTVIYQSDPDNGDRIGTSADAQIALLTVRPSDPGGPQQPPASDSPTQGRWLLSVRHQAGSVDTLVARSRIRNIAVTTGILALMLLTITALVRFTRRAQALSQLQMQFVAGVSHELRTPLTVIRTAAHNLSSGIVRSGDVNQIQRYGQLITAQTDKLTALVEQVLGFANAESGRVISKRETIHVESLINQALADCGPAIAESRCTIESTIAPDIQPLFGDPMALRHALQNLLTNAAKYGADGHWIGVDAAMTNGAKNKQLIEIRVTDRGAGIPADERGQIFEPFYRGRRAIDDQVHGTGLGLALVKRIVEAHGGTVEVRSGPEDQGTEFALRIPPAPPEKVDEFADITR